MAARKNRLNSERHEWHRDEEILVNRLHSDVSAGKRKDRDAACIYLAKLLDLERSVIDAALTARLSLEKTGPAISPQAQKAWKDFEGDQQLQRRLAEAIDAQLWQRFGETRFTFEEWRTELQRVIDHEGGRLHRTIPRAEQQLAFDRRLSPWMFYTLNIASSPGSLDDIPML